jgi:uncharacterized protein (TIGR00251 family)
MSRRRPTARPADTEKHALLEVRVIPRAGRSGIAGVRDGALVVKLAAAPVDGAANAELIAVLAEALGVPRRRVEIVSGERARLKRVRVVGMDRDAAILVLRAS